jgi:hypothetical protein
MPPPKNAECRFVPLLLTRKTLLTGRIVQSSSGSVRRPVIGWIVPLKGEAASRITNKYTLEE